MYVAIIAHLCYAQKESPLCMYCDCDDNKEDIHERPHIVISCTSAQVDIFDSSMWKNSTTDYEIRSFTLQHKFMGNLSKELPSRTLLELYLTNDEITSVNVNSFKKLDLLVVLVLSHNLIDGFTGNVTQVRI